MLHWREGREGEERGRGEREERGERERREGEERGKRQEEEKEGRYGRGGKVIEGGSHFSVRQQPSTICGAVNNNHGSVGKQ